MSVISIRLRELRREERKFKGKIQNNNSDNDIDHRDIALVMPFGNDKEPGWARD